MRKRFILKSLAPNNRALRYCTLVCLFVAIGMIAYAQNQAYTVKGTVTDNTGQTVIGATVTEKGSSARPAITDVDGKYTITVSGPNAILVFTSMGYVTLEYALNGRAIADVTMDDDAKQLEEVVVVGFGTQRKANLSDAVSSVKMENVLGSRPVASLGQALSGAVPGLQVAQASGSPGASASLSIRGIGSIRLSNGSYVGAYESPLILVDNVPIEDMSMVNPEDIETVNVLKDASASAIHGARAAFGVVLITTKKGGKDQRPRINYSNNFTFNTPMELADKASTLQNVQGWLTAGFTNNPRGGGQVLGTWKDLLEQYAANPSQYPNGYEIVGGIRYDLKQNDLYKEFLDNSGFQQTHNVSVIGGTQRSNYRMSFGYTNQDGVIVTDKDSYTRYTASVFAGTEVTKWLNAQAEAMYSNSNQSMPNASSNGNYWGKAAAFLSSYPLGETDYLTPGEVLPLLTPANMVKYGDVQSVRKDDIRLVGRLIATPMKGLTFTGEFTFYNNRYGLTNYNKVAKMVDADKWAIAYLADNSSKFTKDNNFNDHTALNIYGNYQKTFAQYHNLSVTAGFNQEYDYAEYLTASNTDMINANLPSIKGGTGTASAVDNYQEFAIRGAYYRVEYDYKGKYMFKASGRYDGSSRFPKDDRFGFFPSFSGAWRVTEERFMQGLRPYLSNFKLRASWGSIGNQNVSNYGYYAEMGSGYAVWADGSGTRYRAMGVPALVSDSFTWEKVQTIDLGFDAAFFNNRLNAVFDWYDRQTIGMLAPGADLPAVIGANPPRENTADLSTKGWELDVSWKDQIGQVSYHIGFNISDSQTEVTKFDDNETKLLNQMYAGKKIGEIWGLTTDRYYNESDFIDYTVGTLQPGIPKIKGLVRPWAGDVIYKDLDGDGEIITGLANNGQTLDNPGDYRVIGNSTARYNFGITGGLAWNNIDFSFFLQGVGKRDIWYGINYQTVPFGVDNFGCLYQDVLDYWTPENPNAKYARFYNNSGSFTSYNYNTQTKYLQSGAFLRIKNITIGYTIPRTILDKAGIQKLRIFCSAENLYTFKSTPKGIEPDLSGQGNTNLQYPFMRMFAFGLNLTF